MDVSSWSKTDTEVSPGFHLVVNLEGFLNFVVFVKVYSFPCHYFSGRDGRGDTTSKEGNIDPQYVIIDNLCNHLQY